MSRKFLFLQGVCSPFFNSLAVGLQACGHGVAKVNFNAGDVAYWRKGDAFTFRGRVDDLRDFYTELFQKENVSDVVLFGDRRPVHKPAIEIAKNSGIKVHVYEEGYFRPFWITLERSGVNANSLLPRDPNWYKQAGLRVARYGDGEAFRSPFWIRAAHDVAYNTSSLLNPLFFPNYRTHSLYAPMTEYAAYVRRAIRVTFSEKRDAASIASLVAKSSRRPFFLFPLQLSGDSQIRDHSQFNDIGHAADFVMSSFAAHANARSILVIKNHPLDPGIVDHAKLIRALVKKFGLEGRVVYLESGHLPTLLSHCDGVVTVNSTVGGSALVHRRPTIALSKPIYDIPGLTFQEGLDFFWRYKRRPNRELFRNFRNVVVHATQVNGGFYCHQGISMAVDNSITNLISSTSKLEELL